MGITRGTHEDRPEHDHEQFSVERTDTALIVRLRGQFLGGEETDQLRSTLARVPESITRIILDLSQVSFVNSSFLSTLLAEHTSHRRHGREVRLADLRATVRSILDLTHLSSVIPVFDSIEHASS